MERLNGRTNTSFAAFIVGLYERARGEIYSVRLMLKSFGRRNWLISTLGGLATLALIGIPEVIIPNPFFTRQTPVRAQDYGIWVLTALLLGLVAGTYVSPVRHSDQGKAMGGGVLSFLSVGCPICNKLVVALLGVSGALTFFEPAQLYIGIISLALVMWTLLLRARAFARASCPLLASQQQATPAPPMRDVGANR